MYNTDNNINDYLECLKSEKIKQSIYRIDILNKDGTIADTISGYVENNSGSITISNGQGSRRTASITIKNYKNEFTDYFSKITIGSRFKVSLGYIINNVPYLFPQGVFIYSDPELNSQLSNKTITISGSDKFSLLDGSSGGILNGTYQYDKGHKVGDLILKLLQTEIVKDFVPPDIPTEVRNMTTVYDVVHQTGDTVADIILDVAFSLSCYVYYDVNGVFTMRKFEYDIELPSLYSFTYGDFNYLGANKTYDIANIYNAVLVVGSNMQDEKKPITSYLENNDVTDCNSVINGNTLKVFVVTEYTDGIDTQQKADERCRYELKIKASMQSKIALKAMAMYHLKENTIVEITDSFLSCQRERFLIVGITFDIGSDSSMTLSLAKAREYL